MLIAAREEFIGVTGTYMVNVGFHTGALYTEFSFIQVIHLDANLVTTFFFLQ